MKSHISRRLFVHTVICFGLLLSTIAVVHTQPATGYHLLKKFVLGGEGRWDYITCDSDAHRLYISRSTHVMVVDSDSGQLWAIYQTRWVCTASPSRQSLARGS